jgi:hypothetical protein
MPITPGQQIEIGAILCIVGFGIFASGGFWGISQKNFIASAAKAEGVVVRLEWEPGSSSDDSSAHHTVVAFKSADGRDIEFRSGVGSSPLAHSKGDRVGVLYDPNSPSKAKINTFVSLWLGPIILALIGSLVFFAGLKKTKRQAS